MADRRKTRRFGNYVFVCQRPGSWMTRCGTFWFHYEMDPGFPKRWEIYRRVSVEAGFGQMIASGATMADAGMVAFEKGDNE